MKKKKQNYFIQDMVLSNSDEDFFRHKDLSKNIASIINNNTYRAPYNIALIGKWGLGKSSLLKFIEPQISNNCMVFTINAWKYEKESLKKKFLKNIYEEITNKKTRTFDNVLDFVTKILKKEKKKIFSFRQTLKDIWENTWKWLLFILVISIIYTIITANVYVLANQIEYNTIFSNGIFNAVMKFFNYYFNNLSDNFLLPLLVAGAGWCITTILENVKTPINIEMPINDADDYEIILKTEINALLEKKHKEKVVIIIDDLDRLSTNKIVEALDTLKSLMEINNCIFIVPFDDTLIKSALEKKVVSQVDSEHQTIKSELILDKLFQFKFYLAPLIKSDIKDYTINMIKNEAPGFVTLFNIDGINYFEEIAKKAMIYNGLKTPRQIKKIVNVLSNNLLILKERCKYNKTENNLLDKNGLYLLTKLSVLQADFNDFFDTLYIKNDNIETLLSIHERPIPWEDIPYELKFIFENKNKFNKGMAQIKKENEILINYLSQTKSIYTKNISPYLYLNQDKLSVKYGSEFNARITSAIESANVKTALGLIAESKNDLNELLCNILEDTQQEELCNTLISLYGIINNINSLDKNLLILLSEKTNEYFKINTDFDDIEQLQINNMVFVYKVLSPGERKGTEMLLMYHLDKIFNTEKGIRENLVSIINNLISDNESFSQELKNQIKKCIVNSSIKNQLINIDYFVNNVNLFSANQYYFYLGFDFYKVLCKNITSLQDDSEISEKQVLWLNLAVDSLIENNADKDLILEELSELYNKQSNMKVLNNLVFKYWGDKNEQ